MSFWRAAWKASVSRVKPIVSKKTFGFGFGSDGERSDTDEVRGKSLNSRSVKGRRGGFRMQDEVAVSRSRHSLAVPSLIGSLCSLVTY